jgi:hypothetical protein
MLTELLGLIHRTILAMLLMKEALLAHFPHDFSRQKALSGRV